MGYGLALCAPDSSPSKRHLSRPVVAFGLTSFLLLLTALPVSAQSLRDRPLFPKHPPPAVRVKSLGVKGLSYTISGVPEYQWYYGCSPTAAGMIIGWWDTQSGCTSLFDGSAATWSGNTNAHTMVASAAHIAAGQALGLTYGTYKNHVADCLADFLCTHNSGTDRDKIGPGLVSFCAWAGPSAYKNTAYAATATTYYEFNGWTYENYCAEIDAGRPVHLGLTSTAGGHSVVGIGYDKTGGKQNYICWTTWPGWGVRSWGWTGESESGYNFYVYAGTYLRVTPNASAGPPTAPTSVTVSPSSPVTTSDLVGSASGSTNPDGATISYDYQWARSTDGGTTWSTWDWSGATLSNTTTTRGELWKVQARANDGTHTSAWVASASVTVANSAPTTPSAAMITPTAPDAGGASTDLVLPGRNQIPSGWNMTAAASGATDADGDAIAYVYEWAKSTDGASTWSDWNWSGATVSADLLTKGECWKVRVRSTEAASSAAVSSKRSVAQRADGTSYSWFESAAVTIVNSAPTTPAAVTLAPSSPGTEDDVIAVALGVTDADADALTYTYEWAVSADEGTTWGDWGNTGATLSASLTTRGEQWKARARAFDGTVYSDWCESSAVTIGDTAPSSPSSVVIAPVTLDATSKSVDVTEARAGQSLTASASGAVDIDGDVLGYEYQWACQPRGSDWGEWGSDGATLPGSQTAKGQQWKARARAIVLPTASSSGRPTLSPGKTSKGWVLLACSAWVESAALTIGDAAPTAPRRVWIRPGRAAHSLAAHASGAGDRDGDAVTYQWCWRKWHLTPTPGWGDWLWLGTKSPTGVARGERWQLRARTLSGTPLCRSEWVKSAAFVMPDAAPTAPTAIALLPTRPNDVRNLTAEASGATDPDGDAVSYVYEWSYWVTGGWVVHPIATSVLPGSETAVGQRWRVRAKAVAGLGGLCGAYGSYSPIRTIVAVAAPVPATVSAASAVARSGAVVEVTLCLTGSADVLVRILNLVGREVAVLPARSLEAGTQSLLWNGRSSRRTAVPAGQYLVRIEARQANGTASCALAPLSLRR